MLATLIVFSVQAGDLMSCLAGKPYVICMQVSFPVLNTIVLIVEVLRDSDGVT